MPITPTYPGVYIQEIPSGVHTITGVSTSVTAFAGLAKTGEVTVATRVLSFADYERSFGGQVSYSEMSYAVRQFFLNGGSEAWVIRLVGQNTTADSFTLQDGAATPEDVLKVISLTPAESGRNVQVLVDSPSSPADDFNLTFISTAKDNPVDIITETFSGLSMDRTSANYVVTEVNGASKLVKIDDSVQSSAVKLNNNFGAIRPTSTVDKGSWTSGIIQSNDIASLPSAQSNSLRIGL